MQNPNLPPSPAQYTHSNLSFPSAGAALSGSPGPLSFFNCTECCDTGWLRVFCPENGTDIRPCDFCEEEN